MRTLTIPPSVRINMEKYKRIKRLLVAGLTHAQIAEAEGYSRQNVSRIAKNLKYWEAQGWL